MTNTITHWSAPGYSDIVSARHAAGDIDVEFANGDVVVIPASTFGIATTDFELVVADGGLSIRAIQDDGVAVDISWTQVRTATDPEFAKELRRRDAEESRRLGLRLKALREDRGVTQRDLAKLVAMPAPQLSKIESGTFDLRVSTVQALLRALDASFADIAGPAAPEVSQKKIAKLAEGAGVPRDLMDRLFGSVPRSKVSATLERLFGWSAETLSTGSLHRQGQAVTVQFKAASAQVPHESPLVDLAIAVSRIVRKASQQPPFAGVPADPASLHAVAKVEGAGVTLESLTRWSWKAGVPVIPLHGRKGFCAATLLTDDALSIVLKDPRELAVFWLFDLAHELGHIACGHTTQSGVVDLDKPKPHGDSDGQETDANDYALSMLLPDHEKLLQRVRREARGSHLRFKGAVGAVAAEEGVNPALLGMVAAYELTEVGENKDRWGSATNLAKSESPGRIVVQREAILWLNRERLDEDTALLDALVLAQ
jgi:transcriptional regulator with XRE-family HTH domain